MGQSRRCAGDVCLRERPRRPSRPPASHRTRSGAQPSLPASQKPGFFQARLAGSVFWGCSSAFDGNGAQGKRRPATERRPASRAAKVHGSLSVHPGASNGHFTTGDGRAEVIRSQETTILRGGRFLNLPICFGKLGYLPPRRGDGRDVRGGAFVDHHFSLTPRTPARPQYPSPWLIQRGHLRSVRNRTKEWSHDTWPATSPPHRSGKYRSTWFTARNVRDRAGWFPMPGCFVPSCRTYPDPLARHPLERRPIS